MDGSPIPGPRTVAMLNQKGGVGKTTTTANLGHSLAVAGMRVCLIDLDPQGHLTLHLGIEAEAIDRTVYDLLVDPECTARDCIIKEARPNLDVILAEVDLAAAEQEIAGRAERQSILRRKFEAVKADYDVVLIDCPPSLGMLTVNALTMADELLVPMQAHFLALQGVGRLLETVRLVCDSVNPQLRVAGVILCMFERQTTLAREILADLEDFFDSYRDEDVPWSDCHVLKPPIRRNIKLAEAPSFGNTIFDYAPWCPGAIDYRNLAARLLERWGFGRGVGAVPDVDDDADEAAPSNVDGTAQENTPPDARPTTASAGVAAVSVGAPKPDDDATDLPATDASSSPDRSGPVDAPIVEVVRAPESAVEPPAPPASEVDADAEPVAPSDPAGGDGHAEGASEHVNVNADATVDTVQPTPTPTPDTSASSVAVAASPPADAPARSSEPAAPRPSGGSAWGGFGGSSVTLGGGGASVTLGGSSASPERSSDPAAPSGTAPTPASTSPSADDRNPGPADSAGV